MDNDASKSLLVLLATNTVIIVVIIVLLSESKIFDDNLEAWAVKLMFLCTSLLRYS